MRICGARADIPAGEELGIWLPSAEIPILHTTPILYRLGVNDADLPPTEGADPNHVAVEETVIQLDDERIGCTASSERVPCRSANESYALGDAVDPDSIRLHHVRLYSTRTRALIELFRAERRAKRSSTAQPACGRPAIERVFLELKQRTN